MSLFVGVACCRCAFRCLFLFFGGTCHFLFLLVVLMVAVRCCCFVFVVSLVVRRLMWFDGDGILLLRIA